MGRGSGGNIATVRVGRPKGVSVGRPKAAGNFTFSPGRTATTAGGTTRPGKGVVATGVKFGKGMKGKKGKK